MSTKHQYSVRTTATNGSSSADPPSPNYKTELFIPVRQHESSFADLHRARFENDFFEQSSLRAEMDKVRRDWDSRLDSIRKNMFSFNPLSTGPASGGLTGAYTLDPGVSIAKSPMGNPEFSVQFDVKEFKPEEISVAAQDNQLVISAKHEEKGGPGVRSATSSVREFRRTVDIPRSVLIDQMKSSISADGVLSVVAPLAPPSYPPIEPMKAMNVSQQNTGSQKIAVAEKSESASGFHYRVPVSGFAPEEVSVSVDGQKVTIHAKHEEKGAGRSSFNEMKKSFDLPSTVDPSKVRSYVKDGHTLFIEASLRDDLQGKIQTVPVTRKV